MEQNLNAIRIKASFDGDLQNVVNQIQQAFGKMDFSKVNANISTGFDTSQKAVTNFTQAAKTGIQKVVSITEDLNGNLKQTSETITDTINGFKTLTKKKYDEYGELTGSVTFTDSSHAVAMKAAAKEEEKIMKAKLNLVKNLSDAYDKLNNAETKTTNGKFDVWNESSLTGYSQKLDEIGSRISSATTNLAKLNKENNLLNNTKSEIDFKINISDETQRKVDTYLNQLETKAIKLKSSYSDLFNEEELKKISDKYLEQINAELKKMTPNADKVSSAIHNWKKEVTSFDTQLASTNKKLQNTAKETEGIERILSRFTSFYALERIGFAAKSSIMDMVDTITDIDTALVELKKVTDETDSVYTHFLDNATKKSAELGVTVTDYIDSVTNFARMGYSFDESQTIAETANIMQVVSESLTASESAEYLISIMAAFGIEAENSLMIVDKLNNISNNFAITTDGLGEALKRSSSAMRVANNTLDETIALITTANTVTQNPESVGNALKTVSMRIRGTKMEDDEDGDTVVSPGVLRKQILDTVGVDIIDEVTGEFKSTYEILLAISKEWDKIDGNTQSGLLEKLAGKHRATVVASILNDYETLEKAYETVVDSDGSALTEFEKRTESIAYAMNELTVVWQEFSLKAIDNETIISVIDSLKSFLEIAGNVGLDGIFSALVSGVGGLITTVKLLPSIDKAGQDLIGKNISVLGKEFTVAAKDVEVAGKKISPAVAGMTNVFGSLFKTLGKASLIGVGLFALEQVISKVFDVFDSKKNKIEDFTEAVLDTEDSISTLKKELEELEKLINYTDNDNFRINTLKEQIELQEQLLEKKRELLQTEVVSSTTDFFDGDTKSHATDNSVERTLKQAKEAKDNLVELQQSISEGSEKYKNYSEDIARYTDNIIMYENEFIDYQEGYEEYVANQQKLNDSYEEAIEKLSGLVDLQQQLQNAVNNTTGAEQSQAKQALSNLEEMIYSMKLAVGLADTVGVATKKYNEFLSKLGNLDNVVTSVQKLGSSAVVSAQEMQVLEREFPELAKIIEQHSEKIENGYRLEKEAIDGLLDAQKQAEIESLKLEKNKTEAVLYEVKQRISAYELEHQAIAALASDLNEAAMSIASDLNEVQGWYGLDEDSKRHISANNDTLVHLKKSALRSGLKFTVDNAADYNEYLSDLEKYQSTQTRLAEIIEQINELERDVEYPSGNNPENDPASNNNNTISSKTISSWDSYANAIEAANQKIERYGHIVDIAQAKLSLNQTQEERTPKILEEELQLYDELLKAKGEQYQLVNDTLYSQMQELELLNRQAAAASGIDYDTLKGMTDADIEKHIELKLDDDTNSDQVIAKLLNGFVTIRNSVEDLHVEWYELKEDIADTNFDAISVRIDFENDILDKMNDTRSASEKLLGIFEDMESTEKQRLEIISSLEQSYKDEYSAAMAMYNSNATALGNLIRQNKQGSNEYQAILKQNNSLEEHMLDLIQQELSYKKQRLQIERDTAIAAAEVSVYGEQGQTAWEKARQNEIKQLQEQLEALEEDKSEEDYLEELAEKEKTIADLETKLANLRQERTIMQLEKLDDGSYQWSYVVDELAISETLKDLEEAKKELQEIKNAKALEDEKQIIQDKIDAIQDEIDERADLYEELEYEVQQHYDNEIAALEKYTTKQIEELQQHVLETSKSLKDLDNKTNTGLKSVTQTTKTGLENLQEAYSVGFSSMISQYTDFVSQAISIFNRLEEARRAAAEAARSMTDGQVSVQTTSIDGSHALGLKKVKSNNYIASLHYGERVLTRQEAEQYNSWENIIKSGSFDGFFSQIRNETIDLISSSIQNGLIGANSQELLGNGNGDMYVTVQHVELPNVQNPADFATEINKWAISEFSGMSQRAKIKSAK